MITRERISKAWNQTSGTKGTKTVQTNNLQVKDITYVDLIVEGCDLAARDRNGFSDPYFVIKVPTEETKHSHLTKVALEVAEVGELIYHVVAYSVTPYLIPFKIAHVAWEFACKTHPSTKGFKEIYKSAVIKKNLNPKFPQQRLGFYELCWGDVDLPFLIEVWDWDRLKSSDLIGSCFISCRQLFYSSTTEIEIRDKDDKKTGILKLKCFPSNALSDIPPKQEEETQQTKPEPEAVSETNNNSYIPGSSNAPIFQHANSVPVNHPPSLNHQGPIGLVSAHSVCGLAPPGGHQQYQQFTSPVPSHDQSNNVYTQAVHGYPQMGNAYHGYNQQHPGYNLQSQTENAYQGVHQPYHQQPGFVYNAPPQTGHVYNNYAYGMNPNYPNSNWPHY